MPRLSVTVAMACGSCATLIGAALIFTLPETRNTELA